jgi:hypothetical protein
MPLNGEEPGADGPVVDVPLLESAQPDITAASMAAGNIKSGDRTGGVYTSPASHGIFQDESLSRFRLIQPGVRTRRLA